MKLSQQRIRILHACIVLTTAIFLMMFQSCESCQRNSGLDQDESKVTIDIENENVKDALEKELNSSLEDEQSDLSQEEKEEVRAAGQKRMDIIKEELDASPNKNQTDEEIILYLNKELDRYKNTCDTAVFNGIRKLMNQDTRIKVFGVSEVEFSHDYRRRMKEAMVKCKRES